MKELTQQLGRIEALLRIRLSDVLTVKEVALLTGKSESRIRHMVTERSIPHYRNGRGQISFLKSEIEEWKLGERVATHEETERKAATYTALNRRYR